MSRQERGGSEPDRRSALLDAIARVLIDQKRSVIDLDDVLAHSHVWVADLDAEFKNSDDLLVALVEHFAESIARPLLPTPGDGGDRFTDMRGKLLEFSTGLHEAYSTILIGFCRLAMTEGSRHKAVRKQVFDKGAGAVTAFLADFLQHARAAGKIRTDDCPLAAEQLIGMLREPLYQELTLRSTRLLSDGKASEIVPAAVDMFLHGCAGSRNARS